MADIVLDRTMLGKPAEKYWISYIRSRIKKNKNFLGFISGQTGSGKSWSTLSICEELDPDFGIDRVVFGGMELMTLINSGKLKRGSAICFEEVGVELSNKNWASTTNKMFSYLLQTFRHRGFILIMNSPYMDFVDAGMRKLFHAEMQTLGIDFNAQECKLKPQLLQYNGRLRKFYYKRLKVIKPEGVVPVDVWKVPKPSDTLLAEYEQKKREYTDNLNRRILDELESAQSKIESKRGNTEVTEIQRDTLEMLRQGLNVDQIAQARSRDRAVIYKTMDLLRKKGYAFNGVRKAGVVAYYDVIEPKPFLGRHIRLQASATELSSKGGAE